MSVRYLSDFSKFVNENYIYYEVERSLNEIVETVEVLDYQQKLEFVKEELDEALQSNVALNERINVLQSEKDALQERVTYISSKALKIRNVFVADIGAVLTEGRNVVKLKKKIKQLEDTVHKLSQVEATLETTQQKLKTVEKAYFLTQKLQKNGGAPSMSLTMIEDHLLLNVFSYLQTEDVLSAAQVNRLLFARVDSLFSIGSQLIRPDWLAPILGVDGKSYAGNAGAAGPPPGDALLSQQLADQLAKKLTGPEMEVIVSMKKELNAQGSKIHDLSLQSEDQHAKLENTERVRDFLIEKLKAAEMAIKTFMKDNADLKTQAAADKEVISFLDLHRLEIDSINRDLLSKNEALRASVDVLTSINAQTEKQSSVEIAELKQRLALAERDFKTQRKMLAKEVKTLRGLLVESNEDLERHRSHLNNLRKSLDIPPQSSMQSGMSKPSTNPFA